MISTVLSESACQGTLQHITKKLHTVLCLPATDSLLQLLLLSSSSSSENFQGDVNSLFFFSPAEFLKFRAEMALRHCLICNVNAAPSTFVYLFNTYLLTAQDVLHIGAE